MIAGFDIGTNTTRLLVLDQDESGALKRIREELAFTRPGEGLARTGKISDAALERTIEAMKKLAARELEQGVTIRGFATEAFRRASNGAEAAKRLSGETGIPVTVLAPEEEANAGLLAIKASFDDVPGEFVLLDIGGGSTEVLRVKGDSVQAESFQIGTVTLSEEYLRKSDPPGYMDFIAARQEATNFFRDNLAPFPKKPEIIYAVGGTATTAAQILLDDIPYSPEKIHGTNMHRNDFEVIVQQLCEMTQREMQRMNSLPAGRSDVALAGMIIFCAVLEATKCPFVRVSAEGILYGLLAKELGIVG